MSFHSRFAFKAEQNFEKSIDLLVSAALHIPINLRAMYAESTSRKVKVVYKHANIHNFATFDSSSSKPSLFLFKLSEPFH